MPEYLPALFEKDPSSEIIIISTSLLNSRLANFIQVRRTVETFVVNNWHVTWILPSTSSTSGTASLSEFSSNRLRLKCYIPFRLFSWQVNLWIYRLYTSRVFLIPIKRVLTRDPFIAILASLLGKSVLLELHRPLPSTFPFVFARLISFLKIKVVAVSPILAELLEAQSHFVQPPFISSVVHNGSFAYSEVKSFFHDPPFIPELSDINHLLPTLCYVGSISERKGLSILKYIASSAIRCNLIIVGLNPDFDPSLFDLSSCVNIRIICGKDSSEVMSVISIADIVLAPYILPDNPNELDDTVYGCPIKLLEYASLGKMIMTSDIPMTRELSKRIGYENIMFASNDDLSEWIVKINKFLSGDSDRPLNEFFDVSSLANDRYRQLIEFI